MTDAVLARFKIRRDTSSNWTSVNPVLFDGEPGYEVDTGRIKYGDGLTAWSLLSYSSGDAESLHAISSLTPSANKVPYYTGSSSASLTDLTAFGRTLIGSADAGAARGSLGLGTMATQNTGVNGSFTTVDGKTVTVTNGIITSIV